MLKVILEKFIGLVIKTEEEVIEVELSLEDDDELNYDMVNHLFN